MRRADREEVWASHRMTPEEALRFSVGRSGEHAWAVERGGRIVTLFGCAPMSLVGSSGTPWLLGSDEIQDIRLTFLKYSRPIVRQLSARFALLENWIDARNTLHLDWARWTGFRVEEPEPYGVYRQPFCRIVMKRGEDPCAYRKP